MTLPCLRRAATALAAVAMLLVVSACAGAGTTAPAPPGSGSATGAGSGGLVAKAATVDLGRVPFNQQVEARFDLTNTSGKPIKLTGQPQVKMLEGC